MNPNNKQFRLICDEAVRKALTEAKPRYGAPRLADELLVSENLRKQNFSASGPNTQPSTTMISR
ncbi:hypothetical protein JV35_10605 [Pectobacterium betavasculorum]|uniref:Transposase n=1 Tax=Pectobacterium betavasculorum TaxID=55207 RepID=A0ABR4V0D3_9GAMM|nr:hypothetical protein JV35_10605 [Pectobacterium betavasculorum]